MFLTVEVGDKKGRICVAVFWKSTDKKVRW